jgi:hypothetical protein
VTATRDQFAELAAALTANKLCNITKIDLSNNQLEDKGLIAISNWIASLGNIILSLSPLLFLFLVSLFFVFFSFKSQISFISRSEI